MSPLKVLLACEQSDTVSAAFRARGHYVLSCDLLPSDNPEANHYRGDIRDIVNDNKWISEFDLMIAHPTCTYLANSGSQWLYNKKTGERNEERWRSLEEGALFFKMLWELPIPKIVIENPVMLGYAKKIIGVSQSQVIQPWMFGDPETKATCLWLKNLPLLKPTNIVKPDYARNPDGSYWRDAKGGRMAKTYKDAYSLPKEERQKARSKTYPGIAKALAEQYG